MKILNRASSSKKGQNNGFQHDMGKRYFDAKLSEAKTF